MVKNIGKKDDVLVVGKGLLSLTPILVNIFVVNVVTS